MLIAIDFDGTVVENKFPEIGNPMPGALSTLRALIRAGHHLILWTCRENHATDPDQQYLADAVRWFEPANIPLAGVNETPEEFEFRDRLEAKIVAEARAGAYGVRKAFAHIYIDDRNFPGGFPGWYAIKDELQKRGEL